MAEPLPLLPPEDSARLLDFARACKAAARAVVLYPGGHPSIATTLGRIVNLTSPVHQSAPMRIHVLADNLLLDGGAVARPDPAVTDLAVLLHAHLVGEIIVHAGGDLEGWRNFLQLIGRSPDDVRADGGIARLWTTIAGRHIELREIDYAEVLREKSGGDPVTWERVIGNCLHGDAQVDDESLAGLLEIAGDADRLGNLLTALDARATTGGQTLEAKTAAIVRLIQGVVSSVNSRQPDQLEPVLRNMASAVGQLSPEMMVSLLAHGGGASGAPTSATDLIGSVVSRMTDGTIARFVARNAIAEGTATDRLAQAFHTLVRDGEQRERLLSLAHDDAAVSTPLGSTAGFEDVWSHVAQRLLRSYSDEPFISNAYARELSGARTDAISVEHTSDDPPERVAEWLATVATTELRRLDLALLVDLLRIEEDHQRWAELMAPIVALIEDLLLVGDFDAADNLLDEIRVRSGPDTSKERRQSAMIAFDMLAAGPMLRHIIGHLQTIDEAQVERVKAMCVSLGEVLVRPLAEALSTEERSRARERLTAILIAFGAAGRRQVERLKSSANPAVRRTAIYLLREFGGSEALPDLTELLDDNEPQVQREAVRAILNIGTDNAFRILEQALGKGTAASREAIMRSLGQVRDERAAPLFAYIINHVDHRGSLGSVYLKAIETLATLKDPEGIPALKNALYRGEWWAPRRSAALRRAAAGALARIGTPDALDVLDEALLKGGRGVRAAARTARPKKRASTEGQATA
jgi:HEAT repeat protein